MLTSEAKRRIDGARQVLVGVLPNPMQQVEQITIALIYKFMDDMDEEARRLPNGKGSFFVGELKEYSWHNLMDTRLTNQDKLNRYQEATKKISESEKIPELFRSIFRNTYLPFNDPRILGLFLSEINQFDYDNSEELGNAYEYLLSIMGSQGDAGQFRTPRHIIDFIVRAIDPKKDDRILDPACGTAGFLISAYKHIIEAHDGIDNKTGKPTGKETPLTASERSKIHKNITGYDIDPNMVKTAKVNTYLHKFKNPDIKVYDTISKTEHWDEEFDVILANPPFMTPKGGIEPHSKFKSKAKRAEVLFVDYILEHLSLKGRAGIIVPEGVVFQSANAYKALRKDLVEDGLYAVVSLPSGVFNPYSGVKTSILLFDKDITKKNKEILFLKINQDGFDLGAQRRETPDKNDLPLALEILREWKGNQKVKKNQTIAFAIKKTKIVESGDYNLIGDRYREVVDYSNVKWEMVELGDVLDYEQPTNYIVSSTNYNKNYKIPVLTAGKSFLLGYTDENDGIFSEDHLPVIIFDDFTTATKFVDFPFKVKSSAMKILKIKDKTLSSIDFIFLMMKNIDFNSSTHKRYWISQYAKIKIPLPPLEIQKQIVKELDGYQKVIDGAKQVVENWKPNIKIDPDWEMVELEKLLSDKKHSMKAGPFGSSLKKEFYVKSGYKIYGQEHVIKNDFTYGNYYIDEEKFRELESCKIKTDDILISLVGTIGKIVIVPPVFEKGIINPRLIKITLDEEKMMPIFFQKYFQSDLIFSQLNQKAGGVTMPVLNGRILKTLKFPLAPMKIQEKIIEDIEIEQKIVDANKKLIEIFEQKLKTKISEVWGQ
ncbi:MAG: N-6 DNA methylase [Candidatus Moraniibacteriota bacterium]|jgi:type I restriction enzyme M protein